MILYSLFLGLWAPGLKLELIPFFWAFI